MRTLLLGLLACLSIPQIALADYILASGSNDTGANGGQSVIRYSGDFQVVWERSPAKGTAETQVFALEINPANGDLYTSQIANPQLGKHLSYKDGAYIGRVIPTGGQTDGTGKYTAPGEAVQDIQFGYDYNKDGVQDLWVCRRDTFEVYDGTTLNRAGDTGIADLLTSLKIADSGGTTGIQDGTGGFGITFGPDVTGDSIGELFATTADWQPWRIPYSEFTSAGVDLASVEKLCIGVGDRGAAAPGGAGLLLIDDIEIGRPIAGP